MTAEGQQLRPAAAWLSLPLTLPHFAKFLSLPPFAAGKGSFSKLAARNAQQPAPRRSRAGPAPPVAPGSGSNGAATTRQRRQGRAEREAAAQPGWFWLKNKAPAALLLSAARLKRAHTAPDGDCQFAAAVQADAALQGYHLSAPQLRSKTAELRRKVAIALRTNEAVRKLVLADGADPDALALRIERMAYSASGGWEQCSRDLCWVAGSRQQQAPACCTCLQYLLAVPACCVACLAM